LFEPKDESARGSLRTKVEADHHAITRHFWSFEKSSGAFHFPCHLLVELPVPAGNGTAFSRSRLEDFAELGGFKSRSPAAIPNERPI